MRRAMMPYSSPKALRWNYVMCQGGCGMDKAHAMIRLCRCQRRFGAASTVVEWLLRVTSLAGTRM